MSVLHLGALHAGTLFLGGCLSEASGEARKGAPGPGESTPEEDSAPPGDSGADDSVVTVGDLIVPAALRLPVMEIGDSGDSASLEVYSPSGTAELQFRAGADLSITGDPSPLSAGETRRLTVTYTGSTARRRLFEGAVTVGDGEAVVAVVVSAVVAHADLPDALVWESSRFGEYFVAELPSAPFPYGGASWDDPSVLVYLAAPIQHPNADVITHLHGHNASLRDVVRTQYLLEQSALSGRDAVLIVPQGPESAASGDFGRLADDDGHLNLVSDVLALLYREGRLERPVPGLQALTSHSGGYVATAAILERGGLPIHAVHLFDSVYGYESTFAAFARAGGVLRSLYTATGGTDDNNRGLRDTLEGEGYEVGRSIGDLALRDQPVSIVSTDSSHSGCVSDTRNYARLLAASGLQPGRYGAPELLYSQTDGGSAAVAWLDDPGGVLEVEVGGVRSDQSPVSVNPSDSLTATCADGSCLDSDRYGATGSDWLIVDGFDRVLTGSYSERRHDFASRVGQALGGETFSVASNEAVGAGLVALADFGGVIWLLGDESTADLCFDEDEQARVEAYLDGGGRLLVSGSELGYATASSWLSGTLGIGYAADDAGTNTAGTFTFGTIYEEDYPDVLSGEQTLLRYDTGGAAAVAATPGDGSVVAVGFGVENVDDAELPTLMALLLAPFG